MKDLVVGISRLGNLSIDLYTEAIYVQIREVVKAEEHMVRVMYSKKQGTAKAFKGISYAIEPE